MATKNNTKTFRLSDEMLDLIERQVGNNLSEKFENLITRCVWELPQKETELQQIQNQIQEKKEELDELWKSSRRMRGNLQRINTQFNNLERILDQEITSWEV